MDIFKWFKKPKSEASDEVINQPKPGELCFDGENNQEDNSEYPGLSPEDKKRFGFDEKLHEMDSEKAAQILPTIDLKLAYQSMYAATMPSIGALNHKRRIIEEMREHSPVPELENILKQKELVYPGSGHDIEYPLLLGARSIRMVDPGFNEESSKESMLQKLQKLSHFKQVNDTTVTADFDFGKGPEQITIHIDDSYYGSDIGNSEESIKSFRLNPEDTSALIGFASAGPLDRDEQVLESMKSGTYVIDAAHFPTIMNVLETGGVEDQKLISEYSQQEIKDAYNKLGFEYIPSQESVILKKL